MLGYVTEKSGEVYYALKYAAQKGKTVKNVAALVSKPAPVFSPEKLEWMYEKD